jgi:hypothetical protein
MHSNSHLGMSLMAMTHLAASVPQLSYACDTHYPWQSDEVIAGGKMQFNDGALVVSNEPGLGVELDRAAAGLRVRGELLLRECADAVITQNVVPGHRKPREVRFHGLEPLDLFFDRIGLIDEIAKFDHQGRFFAIHDLDGLIELREGLAVKACLGRLLVRIVQIGHQTDAQKRLGIGSSGLDATEPGEAKRAVLEESATGEHEESGFGFSRSLGLKLRLKSQPLSKSFHMLHRA